MLKKYIPEKMVDDFAGRINQFPAMSLEMFWRRGVARSLPGTTEEKNALRDKLYAELSKVNIVE